jgi:hypothetical protein
MKSFCYSVVFCLISLIAYSQVPDKMSYQAVIRNTDNQLVANQLIGMRVSILQGSTSGNAVYIETQSKATNTNGLVSLEIGGGQPVLGLFSNIDWSVGPFFIKTETDINGGTNYTITGTSQMLSVPYALYAKNAGNVNNSFALPTITTLPATNITSNHAVFNANFSGFGVVEKGFVWSTYNNPTALNSEKAIVPPSDWGNFSYDRPVAPVVNSVYQLYNYFKSNTTYYVRAYVLTENNIYLYGESVPFTTLAVGQTGPSGGIVFYDKGVYSDGWRYMETSLNNQNSSPTNWGCNTLNIDNTQISVGSGMQNTLQIINSCPESLPATLCNDFVFGNQSDWFLPSYTELYLLLFNLKPLNLGNFSNGTYWSSTDRHNNPTPNDYQYSTPQAYVVRYPSLDFFPAIKSNQTINLSNTRAVRYF